MSIKEMYLNLVRDGLIKEINYKDDSLSNMDIRNLREFEAAIDEADNLKEELEELREDYEALEEEYEELEDEKYNLEDELVPRRTGHNSV